MSTLILGSTTHNVNAHLDAAISAAIKLDTAAAKCETNVWKEMCLFVWDKKDLLTGTGTEQRATLENLFKEQEKEIKRAHKIDSMPTKYRSAKSSILGAIEVEVALFTDADPTVRGKTEVENDTKDARVPKSTIAKFLGSVDTARKISDKLNTEADLLQAINALDTLRSELVTAYGKVAPMLKAAA